MGLTGNDEERRFVAPGPGEYRGRDDVQLNVALPIAADA